jgi:hypothetical protein
VLLYVRTNVNKFVKGALARNTLAELIDRLLETIQLAEENRERRKRVLRRVVQKGGVIEVHEARKQIRWTYNYNYDALK